MARIERQPEYNVRLEDVRILIDMLPCIGCGEIEWERVGLTPIEEVLKRILCDRCRGTLQAFRYLAEPGFQEKMKTCTCPSPRAIAFGESHLDGCPALVQKKS